MGEQGAAVADENMSDSHSNPSDLIMDRTPEKSHKIGPDRVALLTGTYKRPSPYPDRSERKRTERTGNRTANESMDSLASLPATRAVLAAMTTLPSPAASSFNKSYSTPGIDFKTSIKRAAIDWKLANKEAEVFKLKTDIQKLESVIGSRLESEQALKIQHEKELAKAEVEKQTLTSKIRVLEQEVVSNKSEIAALRQVETELQTAFLPEKEELEKTIVELKINDCDLRAKVLDAEEEMKSAKLLHDHERLKMGHEIKCLNLELESLRMEKKLLEESNRSLKKEVHEMIDLRKEADRLQAENKSLTSALKSHEESSELRRLFQDDMDELRRLREENADLKRELVAAQVPVAEPVLIAEVPSPEEEEQSERDNLMSEEGEGSSMRSDSPILQVHELEEDVIDEDDDEECYIEMGGEESEADDVEENDDDSDIAEVSSD